MACPECSVMDWSGEDDTKEHHPRCSIGKLPETMRAAVVESLGGSAPTLVQSGKKLTEVYPDGLEYGMAGPTGPVSVCEKPTRVTFPTLCKSCNLPVGSGGCICVENPERKDKGYKIPFRSIEVKDRMLHFLSSDMRVDVDLTPIWSWLEEGGGFKTAFQGAAATPAGDASDLLVIERRNGGRIVFSPKIGAWSPPITGPELPATFMEALGLPIGEEGNWRDVSGGVSGAEKMRGQSTDRVSKTDEIHREFYENIKENAIVRAAMEYSRCQTLSFEASLMMAVNALVKQVELATKAMLGSSVVVEFKDGEKI